jgi:hypothetical protein
MISELRLHPSVEHRAETKRQTVNTRVARNAYLLSKKQKSAHLGTHYTQFGSNPDSALLFCPR